MTDREYPDGLAVGAVRFGRGARTMPFMLVSAGLACLAWVLGTLVTRLGPASTGELPLDQFLSAHRTWPLSELALVIHALLGVSVAPIVLVSIAGLAAKVLHWFAGLAVLVVTSVDWLSAAAGKWLVHRSRPPGATLHALVVETGRDSYPSGHTAFAAGLLASAVVVTYIYGRSMIPTLAVGLPGVFAVGASRLYLGVHFLADVVGSCLIAGAATLALLGIYNAAIPTMGRWRRRLLAPNHESVVEGERVPALPAARFGNTGSQAQP